MPVSQALIILPERRGGEGFLDLNNQCKKQKQNRQMKVTLFSRETGGRKGRNRGGKGKEIGELRLRNRKSDEESLQKAVHSLIRQRRVGRA